MLKEIDYFRVETTKLCVGSLYHGWNDFETGEKLRTYVRMYIRISKNLYYVPVQGREKKLYFC